MHVRADQGKYPLDVHLRSERSVVLWLILADSPKHGRWQPPARVSRSAMRTGLACAGLVGHAAVAVGGLVVCGRVLAALGAVQAHRGDERGGFLDAGCVLGGHAGRLAATGRFRLTVCGLKRQARVRALARTGL